MVSSYHTPNHHNSRCSDSTDWASSRNGSTSDTCLHPAFLPSLQTSVCISDCLEIFTTTWHLGQNDSALEWELKRHSPDSLHIFEYLGCLTEIDSFDFAFWTQELEASLFVWWLLGVPVPVFEQPSVVRPSGSSGWGCSGTWIWLDSYCQSHSYMVTSSESSAWTWLAGWKFSTAWKEDTAVVCEALLLISAERWLEGWFKLTTTWQGCKCWWELLRITPLAIH